MVSMVTEVQPGIKMAVVAKVSINDDRYKGETKNQLRHGKGEYFYDNTFFKYKGEWRNGRKHGRERGHGKLLLGDGGYYEGKFEEGEIEGQGYRVFGMTGSTYTGQFHHGEFHGYGLLNNELDGSQYEGEWSYNKRQGQGILRSSDGSVYEGEFHNHKRHGEGTLITCNGDSYEGDWVNGLQHGHGLFKSTNGTVYEGQWKAGVYHGEGLLIHESGFRYQGMWFNGRPADETVGLALSPSSLLTLSHSGIKTLTVEQGQMFSIPVECLNDEGNNVINDNGRSFMVTCFIDKNVVKRNQARPSYNAIKNEGTIAIPQFGDVYQYEILQNKQSMDSSGTTITTSEETIPLAVSDVAVKIDDDSKGILHCGSSIRKSDENGSTYVSGSKTAQMLPREPHLLGGELGGAGPETRSLYSFNNKPPLTTSEEEFLSTLVTPRISVSKRGKVEFNGLYIPPPPAPHVNEVISKKVNPPLVNRSSSLTLCGRNSPIAVPTTTGSSPLSKSKHVVNEEESMNPGKQECDGATAKKRVSGGKTKKSPKNKEKEKLLHIKREKHCASGSYIIQVSEVTTPPLFNKLLPPIYMEVKIVLPKVSLKETTLDKILNKNRTKTNKPNNLRQ